MADGMFQVRRQPLDDEFLVLCSIEKPLARRSSKDDPVVIHIAAFCIEDFDAGAEEGDWPKGCSQSTRFASLRDWDDGGLFPRLCSVGYPSSIWHYP